MLAEKCKPCETYRFLYDVNGETGFSQKMFTNRQNMALPFKACVEDTVHGVETHWLSSKEKSLGCSGQ